MSTSTERYACLADGCDVEVEEGQPLCAEHRRQVQERLPRLVRKASR